MLILTRRPGDTVLIEPRPETLDADLCTLFARPIAVRILRVQGSHVRIGIEAPEGLLITRGGAGWGA